MPLENRTVTIYVRHAAGCKYDDPYNKRCNCRKHLRWTVDGKRSRRKAGTRSWAEAEDIRRELESQLSGKATLQPTGRDLATAIEIFIADKRVQGLSGDVIGKYTRALRRLRAFCEARGVYAVQGVTRELITAFCEDWATLYPSALTRAKLRERYRSFLGYCYQAQWLERVPAWPKVKAATLAVETQPLTPDEYARLLAAVPGVVAKGDPRRQTDSNSGRRSPVEEAALALRVRAFLECMRWTGLAIRDTLTLPKTALSFDGIYRVTAQRAKTGTSVSVPIPPAVALGLQKVADKNFGEYVFWTGKGRPQSATSNWGQRYVVPVFKAAGLHGHCFMVSHRLRDTFAVNLLECGTPMEEVSRLLGHRSIRVTEKHYAKWSKGRQTRADSFVVAAWNEPKIKAPNAS